MSTNNRKKPPIVRLPPKSDTDVALARAAQIAAIFLALLGVLFILETGSFLLAPISLAIVVGLMLGPVAQRLENVGVWPTFSAAITVVLFVAILGALVTAIGNPLASWAERVPQIWSKLQLQMSSLSEPLATVRSLREEIRSVTGETGPTVSVDEGSPMESMATLAPALLAQVLIFLASLYFFIATRHETRLTILKLCPGRRLRWRTAHVFRDVEMLVSSYLLSITIINIGLGLAVGIALWLLGVPSAPLWGTLAGMLNFIIYIGPAVMAAILFGVGLATFDTFSGGLLPPFVYLCLNAIEAQFVTPLVIGRRMTLNPFLIFLAIAFWLWIWGPIGGFIAIPALLILFAVGRNILPGLHWQQANEARRQDSRLP